MTFLSFCFCSPLLWRALLHSQQACPCLLCVLFHFLNFPSTNALLGSPSRVFHFLVNVSKRLSATDLVLAKRFPCFSFSSFIGVYLVGYDGIAPSSLHYQCSVLNYYTSIPGSSSGTRTHNPSVNSGTLYLLSYRRIIWWVHPESHRD